MAGKIVFEVTRLWLLFMTYSRENKYKSRYLIKKRLDGYKEWWQEYQNAQIWALDNKD